MAITYSQVGWQNFEAGGTALSAANLNQVEDGLAAVYNLVNGKGDLIVATAADTLERLGVGSDNQILTADSTAPTGLKWTSAPAGITTATIDAKGDLIAGTADDTVDNLAVGTDGQVLTAASAQATGLAWAFPAAQVGDAIADFTESDGAIAHLRVGTTPFAFVPLIYDVTYSKWVSPQWTVGSIGGYTETSTTNVEHGVFSLPDYKAHTDAGLRLMLRLTSAAVRPGGGGTSTTVSLDVEEYDGNAIDSDLTNIDLGLISNAHNQANESYILSSWTEAGTPAAAAHALVQVLSLISTAGSALVSAVHVAGRWEAVAV